MNEQINKKEESVLFYSLREYHREDLFQLLKQGNITNRENLYELVLDNVADYGRKNGLQAIEKKITPKHFKILLENFQPQQTNDIVIHYIFFSFLILLKSNR